MVRGREGKKEGRERESGRWGREEKEGREREREGRVDVEGYTVSKPVLVPLVSLSYNHILVLHAGCTIVVTRKVITQFKSSVCTEGKRGRKLGWE